MTSVGCIVALQDQGGRSILIQESIRRHRVAKTRNHEKKHLLFAFVFLVPYPCGKARTAAEWAERQSTNARNDYAGVTCSTSECPWQVRNPSATNGFHSYLSDVSVFMSLLLLLLLSVAGAAEELGLLGFLRRSHPVAEPGLDDGSVRKEICSLSGGCR